GVPTSHVPVEFLGWETIERAQGKAVLLAEHLVDRLPVGPERAIGLTARRGAVGRVRSPALQDAEAALVRAKSNAAHAVAPGALGLAEAVGVAGHREALARADGDRVAVGQRRLRLARALDQRRRLDHVVL